MERMDWEHYFIQLAFSVSRRATCGVLSVGAVFVNPDTNSVLSMGYNGSPRGTEHCGEGCDTRKPGENREVCKAVHAEVNGIYNAALNGVSLNGSHMYVTVSPCANCIKGAIQVGVKRVVFSSVSWYPDELALLKEAGIPYEVFTLKAPWWDEREEIEYGNTF